ncbi:uncharacterized protein LOC106467076 [Limulus polyphemus]|uniref:Uncharacterized protein LOC106467076 n=1 Tax=Limulus polyphemus TaxID=6850 RepID=A0ABM1BIU1_LIMPO|nr:uncharacterized protein LOC106467076 [Limulus polyphemus]
MEVEGHGKNVSQTTAQERRTSLGNLSFPEFQSPLSIDTWEEFQARVKTYISIGSSFPVWMLKPLNLSPAFCAQYGWKCVDVDMVKCVTCAAAVCCHLPKPWRSSAVYQECVMELIKLLQKEGHKNSCPWPLIPSSENFVYMKKLHKKEAFREFDERLRSLMTIKNSLPPVSEEVLDKLEITNDTILHICQMAQISDEPEIQMAVLFAMTGWSKRETEGIDYLRCEHCLRESATHLYGSVSLENVETHGFEMSTESEGILVNLEDDTFSPGDTQKELDRKFMKDQAESHSSEGYLQIFVGDDVAEAVQEMVEGDSKETIKELIEDVMLEIINQTVKVVGVASDQKMVEEERAENMREFLTSDTLKDTSGEDKEKTTLQDEVKKRSGIMKGTTENLVGYDSADTVHNVIEIEGINVKEITKNRTFKETVKCYKEEAVEELTGVEIEVSVKDFNMDKSVKHIFDDDKKETVEEHVGEAAAENLKEKKKKEIVEDTVQCENIVIFQKGGKKDDDGEETVEEYMEETTENVKKKIRNESDKTVILEKGMKTETSRGVKEITQNKIVKAILETNKEGTGEKPIEEEMTRDETFKDAVEDDRRESIQESMKEEMAERMKEHTRNETVQHVIEKYKAKYVKEIARNTTFSETIESDRKQNIEKLIEINLTESLKKIAKNQMAKEIKEENRVEMIKKIQRKKHQKV